MFSKLSAALALFAVATQLAVATPPACLIAAISSQGNPSNLKAVCSGSNATSISETICKSCAGNIETAFSAFSSVCSGAGVTVSDTSCTANTTSSVASSTGTTSQHSSTTGGTSHSTGVVSASSGFVTSTANGTYTAPDSTTTDTTAITTDTSASSGSSATASVSSARASGSPSRSASAATSTPTSGAASRLAMDIVGMAAVGAFGAMLAL